MSSIRLIGLESLRLGIIPTSAAMGTTLVTINAIVPDSAHLVIEIPGVTDLYVEEEDLPDIQIIGTSKKTIEFATRDMGTAMLVQAFGGTIAGTVWSASTAGAIVANEKCIEAISKAFGAVKLKMEIPRINVRVGGDLRFTKTESGQINFSCDVLIPASSTKIPPMVITQVAG